MSSLKRELIKEREDELKNSKVIYDERLSNVREEVRNEIQSDGSKW
jgi:hypothetical protein